eukprot:c20009_g3_i2.p1 GENE.c20009_g3_i2~~c20009_g3_i2.p1  ORF type:complete len:733 (-),score=89.72 c20009_g3_i2:145-2343(-)
MGGMVGRVMVCFLSLSTSTALLNISFSAASCQICLNCLSSTSTDSLICCADQKLCYKGDDPVCYWGEKPERPSNISPCLCKPEYGDIFCLAKCPCNSTQANCDFDRVCVCADGGRCANGTLQNCNGTGNSSCACNAGWVGESCSECDPHRSCQHSGFTSSGCVCQRNSVSLMLMIVLSALSGIVAITSAYQYALVSYAYISSPQSLMRPTFLFCFFALTTRCFILIIDLRLNLGPEKDGIMQVVMDIPPFLVVCMNMLLLIALYRISLDRRKQNPFPQLPRGSESRSLIRRTQDSLLDVYERPNNFSRVQDLLVAAVFLLLLTLLLCMLALMQHSANHSRTFQLVRYSVWVFTHALLACFFGVAWCSVRSIPSMAPDPVWTTTLLRSVCVLQSVTHVLRAGCLSAALLQKYVDLVRPTLDDESAIFQFCYYVCCEVIPLSCLLWLIRVRSLTYDAYTKGFDSCFVNHRLIHFLDAINAGGSGTVYAARLLDLTVACKEQTVFDLASLKEVVHEACLLMKLRHSNVVAFYGLSLQHPNCYLITELCDTSLGTLLDHPEILRRMDRRSIVREICQGMQFIHSKSFVHRDLKPGNILIKDGHVKICDLGTATLLRSTMTTRLGTPEYMAPEMMVDAEQTSYTASVDVFSFGILLWSMCSLSHPYSDIVRGNMFELVRRVAQGLRPRRDVEGISEEMWTLMSRCWDGEPSARPSFSDIGTSLDQIFEMDPNALIIS